MSTIYKVKSAFDAIVDGIDDDDDESHIVCCNPNIALCGARVDDLTHVPRVELDEETTCRACLRREKRPCKGCGH